MAYDLTSTEGIYKYLLEADRHSAFRPSHVAKLSGGFGNFAYRIFLENPYITNNSQTVTSVILKHAEPYVAANPDIPYSAERQEIEASALRRIPGLVRSLSLVSLPKLYYEDPDNRVLIMEDLGDSPTLKSLFRTCPPSLEACRQIGTSLGAFLAQLHTATAIECELKSSFEKNVEGRRIAVYASYGSLQRALGQGTSSGGFFNPPIVLTDLQINKLDTLIHKMEERILKNSDVLVMGDFWPGNILIDVSPKLRCTVIDWEMTRPGPPGLDIGQFVAEMLTLRAFHPSASSAVDNVLVSFLETYRGMYVDNSTSAEKILDLAWDIATRCGTHMVVTTTMAAWGSKEQTREVAIGGLDYIFNAIDENVNWLKSSIIGHVFA